MPTENELGSFFKIFIEKIPEPHTQEDINTLLKTISWEELFKLNTIMGLPIPEIKKKTFLNEEYANKLRKKIPLSLEEEKNFTLPKKEKFLQYFILGITYLGISLGCGNLLISYFSLKAIYFWPILFAATAITYTLTIALLSHTTHISKIQDFTLEAKLHKLINAIEKENTRRKILTNNLASKRTLTLINNAILPSIDLNDILKNYNDSIEELSQKINEIDMISSYPMLNFFYVKIECKLKQHRVNLNTIKKIKSIMKPIIEASNKENISQEIKVEEEEPDEEYTKKITESLITIFRSISYSKTTPKIMTETKSPTFWQWMANSKTNLLLSSLMNIFGSTVAVTAIFSFIENLVKKKIQLTRNRYGVIFVILSALLIGLMIAFSNWYLNYRDQKRQSELQKMQCDHEYTKYNEGDISKKITITNIMREFLLILSLDKLQQKTCNEWTKRVDSELSDIDAVAQQLLHALTPEPANRYVSERSITIPTSYAPFSKEEEEEEGEEESASLLANVKGY